MSGSQRATGPTLEPSAWFHILLQKESNPFITDVHAVYIYIYVCTHSYDGIECTRQCEYPERFVLMHTKLCLCVCILHACISKDSSPASAAPRCHIHSDTTSVVRSFIAGMHIDSGTNRHPTLLIFLQDGEQDVTSTGFVWNNVAATSSVPHEESLNFKQIHRYENEGM